MELKYPVPMEMLPVNKGSGQSYGFVLYRTLVESTARKVIISNLKDHGVAMLNFVPVAKLTWFAQQSFILPEVEDVSMHLSLTSGELLLEFRSSSVGYSCRELW